MEPTTSIKNTNRAVSPIHEENGILCRPTEKAEVFALERNCSENQHEDDDKENEIIKSIRRWRREEDKEIVKHTTPEEI